MRNAYLSAALLLVLGGAVSEPSSSPAVPQAQASAVPAPWAAEDPADSLYRAARDALNRNDYSRAADLFRKIRDTYPKSQYTPDAYYWEAFALYRRGGTSDLKAALNSLEQQEKKYPNAATRGDARSLATRIRGELAKRGDPDARAKVDSQAKAVATQGCSDDEDDTRIAALNALLQMDAERAIPILKKVLARRDTCSEVLRRKAVFLVSQKRTRRDGIHSARGGSQRPGRGGAPAGRVLAVPGGDRIGGDRPRFDPPDLQGRGAAEEGDLRALADGQRRGPARSSAPTRSGATRRARCRSRPSSGWDSTTRQRMPRSSSRCTSACRARN